MYFYSRVGFAQLAVAMGLLLAANTASAETVLRWKLKSGETLAVEISQQTQSQVDFGGKSAVTKIELTMRVGWRVADVDEKAIRVQQTIDQIRATLTTPTGSAEFDSSSKTRGTGLAKQLDESLQPLIGAQVEVDFTPLGEVQSAKPVNEAAQKLFAGADAKSGDSADGPRASLAQLFSQSIVRLPEKEISVGDEWVAEDTLSSTAGLLQRKTTYTLDEIVEQGNARLAKIRFSTQLAKPQTTGQNAVRIESQERSGSVMFSMDEGRPVHVEQRQRLATQRTYRDAKIDVLLDSRSQMTFAGEGAKK